MASVVAECTIEVSGLDLVRTLRPLQHGPLDPTITIDASGVWRATRTPEGPATLHFAMNCSVVTARAWGAGTEWALQRVPAMIGAADRPELFHPEQPLLRELHRRFPGLRFGCSGAVFEAMVPIILSQRVTGREAGRSWRRLVRTFSEPAPGPGDLLLPPAPETLCWLGYYDLHPLGVERTRAMTILRVAHLAKKLQGITELPIPAAYALLTRIPGVGPWTAANTAMVALGDADAVPVGDFHLPSIVTWALAGEPRGDDHRMLELLEPYRGQRARVLQLLKVAGPKPERRGPRYDPVPIARL